MVNYTSLAALATRLIAANGRAITLVSMRGAADVPLSGVFVPPNTVRQFGLTALGQGTEFNDLIAMSEEICITAQGDVDVREYKILRDSAPVMDWGIIGLQVLKPGDTNLIAFIGVRR